MQNSDNGQIDCIFVGTKYQEISDPSGERTNFVTYLLDVLRIVVFASLVTACASTRNMLYPDGGPDGSLIVAQIDARFTKDTIKSDKAAYDILMASGVTESEIRDGSIALAKVNCCSGPMERATAIAFYIPVTMSAEVGDIVEVMLGQSPTKDRELGRANMAIRVVQKHGDADGQCRWEPSTPPGQWGRVLFCDWMPNQGWVQEGQRATLYKAWIKKSNDS
jgi:hypothetical protein